MTPLPAELAADLEAAIYARAAELYAEHFDAAFWRLLSAEQREPWLARAARELAEAEA